MNILFPYQFDGRGRTAEATDADYVNELIELVLFTSPGERVNRPDLGCGLLQQVFAPTATPPPRRSTFSYKVPYRNGSVTSSPSRPSR